MSVVTEILVSSGFNLADNRLYCLEVAALYEIKVLERTLDKLVGF